jgi:hypothetical protein
VVKVQRFQNRLDDVASEAQARLLPALERLAPVALTAAEGLGKLVTFTAENPGKAIVAAITASIARAGLESAFRASIERAIIGGAGGIAGAGGIGGGMAALGALGIGAVGVAAAAASADHLSTQTGGWGGIYAGLESAGQSFDKAGVMGMLTGVGHFSALGGFRQGVEDYQNDQARDEAIRLRRAQAAEAIANAQFGTGLPKDQTGRHGKAEQAMVRAQENAKRVGDAVGAALTGRTLNVRVTNAGDIGGAGGGGMPGVDGAGRHNPPPVELAPDFS